MNANNVIDRQFVDRLATMAVFVRVVEMASFSKAATSLRLSKATISKQISRLEDDLGVRLLERTARHFRLTEAGEAYFQGCSTVIAAARSADRVIEQFQSVPCGTLRVRAPSSFGVNYLASAITDFLHRHPKVSINLTLDGFQSGHPVADGFDVIIQFAKLADSRLIARRIAPSKLVFCAHSSYLDRWGRPMGAHDVSHHRFLVQDGMAEFGVANAILNNAVSSQLIANDGDVLRTAVLAGLGIAFLPTFLVGEDIRVGRLEAVLPQYADDSAAIYAVFPHARHLSPKLRAFIDFLAERFRGTPEWDRNLKQEQRAARLL